MVLTVDLNLSEAQWGLVKAVLVSDGYATDVYPKYAIDIVDSATNYIINTKALVKEGDIPMEANRLRETLTLLTKVVELRDSIQKVVSDDNEVCASLADQISKL